MKRYIDREQRTKAELETELKSHPLVSVYERFCGLTSREYDADLWILDSTVYGDYCGGYLQMANFQTLQEEHDWLSARHEGYGSAMLVFQDAHLVDASNEQLISLLESLSSLTYYPVLDDELMYKLEREAGDEAHEDWGRKDFRSELVKLYTDKGSTGIADDIEVMPDPEIDELFWQAVEKCNGGEGYRQGGEGLTIYIDIDRLAKWVFENEFIPARAD